jgi:hypothetical protein
MRQFYNKRFQTFWFVHTYTPKSCEICPKCYFFENTIYVFVTLVGMGYFCSASARISKGLGYQGFLRKRAGSSFGQKRKNLKNGHNFTTFRVNKMFSHKL